MNTMIIHPPIKKKTYYYSRITDENKRIIKLNIPYAVLKQYIALSNKQGYMFNLRVPQEDFALETIQQMETQCIHEMIQHNQKWFKNALSEEKIREFFESCIVHDQIRVYASNIRSSINDTDSCVTISEWIETHKHSFPKTITLSIVCDGMFIYANKFGLRWIVREMKEYQEPEEITPDTYEIVTYWQDKANTFLHNLEEQKKYWLQKVERIEQHQRMIQDIMDQLQETSQLPMLESEIEKLKGCMKVMEEKTFL